ncbi:Aminoacylase-1, partial [Operophtera brumata]
MQAQELGLPFLVFHPSGLPVCVITVLGSDPSLRSILLNSHMDVVPAVEVSRAVQFWRMQAQELGLPFLVFHPSGLPVCVITVLGSDPSLRSILLNSHMDVVPAVEVSRAVQFWRMQAQELGLPFLVFHQSGLPVCVITVLGSDPSLRSILLNSHMDVVPAVEEEWKYPPYSAFMDLSGNIYGRGTQDDKDVAIQYIEAVRRLRRDNIVLKRTIHITLMPDEETGGYKGMKPFTKTDAFRAMNVGFALDEGLPSPDDTFVVTDEDKRPWREAMNVGFALDDGLPSPDDTLVVTDEDKRPWREAMNVGFAFDEGLPSPDDTLVVTDEDKRPWREAMNVGFALDEGLPSPDDTLDSKTDAFRAMNVGFALDEGLPSPDDTLDSKTDAFRAMNVGFALDEGLPSPDDTLVVTDEDKRPWREAMNVGFALDEGLPSPDDTLVVTDEDKRPWREAMNVGFALDDGLPSPDDTLAIKFINVVNNYRKEMKALMKSIDHYDFGRYTSVNINIIAYLLHYLLEMKALMKSIDHYDFGKYAMVVDMRLSSTSNTSEVERMVKSWVTQAGNGTTLSYIRRDDVSKKTTLDNSNPYWSWVTQAGNGTTLSYIRRDDVSKKTTLDNSNPYWVAMRDAINDMLGMEPRCHTFGATMCLRRPRLITPTPTGAQAMELNLPIAVHRPASKPIVVITWRGEDPSLPILFPDEETGGYNGMKSFIKTKEFEALNIGFALDEGFSSNNDTMIVFTQDKRPWRKFTRKHLRLYYINYYNAHKLVS